MKRHTLLLFLYNSILIYLFFEPCIFLIIRTSKYSLFKTDLTLIYGLIIICLSIIQIIIIFNKNEYLNKLVKYFIFIQLLLIFFYFYQIKKDFVPLQLNNYDKKEIIRVLKTERVTYKIDKGTIYIRKMEMQNVKNKIRNHFEGVE